MSCVLGFLVLGAVVGDNSVGMCTHVGYEGFLDGARDLGVQWVRMDANWFHLEPADDQYDWTHMDTWVERATDQRAPLNVFLTLAYTPDWVARHGDTDGVSHNDVPNSSGEWVDFVAAVVSRYRAMGVTHYGLWNEANLGHFFEGTVEEYVDLIVVPGAAAVRDACADCEVLGPDLAHLGDADDYLEAVLTRAPAGTFDIVTHHSYHGFAETGWQVWEGDSYINVLDQQRFAFTRRSLRQVLDAVGWAGPVWMSETGYRAHPTGDAHEESQQAIHVRRVLEEQLARDWYTNTFFYEIHDCGVDQPECDIDGYGLMRAVAGSPGSRQFPTDYRTKPAFFAVRDFIVEHPEIVGGAVPEEDGGGTPMDGGPPTDGGDPQPKSAHDDLPLGGDLLPRATEEVVADELRGGCACQSAGGALWLVGLWVLVRPRR